MSQQVKPLIERLCQAEDPRILADWDRRDGHYVAACRVSADDVPQLINLAWKWLDGDWPVGDEGIDIDLDDAELLPVTAWRTLADLKAEAAVEPLVEMLCELDEDDYDEWVAEEFPHVLGKIGDSAVPALLRVATDDVPDSARSVAVQGLRLVADYHPHTRDRIVASLTQMMASAAHGHVDFNSTLLVELVELQGVEAAEPIERAFAGDLLDVGMMGDWEDVRRELGVEGLGLEMPENPHNSVRSLRRRMGCGIFSDQPIYAADEIDDEAEEAYYSRACDAFSESTEGQQAVERNGDLRWLRELLEFGIHYLGKIVDEMTPGSVAEFAFEFVPRKVATAPETAEEIVCELALFWEYLDRVHKLPAAPHILEWLKEDGMVAELEEALSDSSKFGMAKSFFMAGEDAGYDMTSEAGLDEFMTACNRSLLANQAPTRHSRVGRNDPCPCGSGKKYKKCCL